MIIAGKPIGIDVDVIHLEVDGLGAVPVDDGFSRILVEGELQQPFIGEEIVEGGVLVQRHGAMV